MGVVLGIDAGGSKTVALLADGSGRVISRAEGGGANLRVHGELEVEKVLYGLLEKLDPQARRADALAIGIAGADRPEDGEVLRAILARLGFRDRVVVTNDARIAFVAGSPSRVGLALVCGTGSIAWGRNAAGEVGRAGGWGWHLGDEGSGFWIGVRAVREALRAADGRGPATRLQESLITHFEIAKPEQILRAVYDGEFPRHRVAAFAVRVEEAALARRRGGPIHSRGGRERAGARRRECSREIGARRRTLRRGPRGRDLPGGADARRGRRRAAVRAAGPHRPTPRGTGDRRRQARRRGSDFSAFLRSPPARTSAARAAEALRPVLAA